MTAGLDVQRS